MWKILVSIHLTKVWLAKHGSIGGDTNSTVWKNCTSACFWMVVMGRRTQEMCCNCEVNAVWLLRVIMLLLKSRSPMTLANS